MEEIAAEMEKARRQRVLKDGITEAIDGIDQTRMQMRGGLEALRGVRQPPGRGVVDGREQGDQRLRADDSVSEGGAREDEARGIRQRRIRKSPAGKQLDSKGTPKRRPLNGP